MVVEKDSPDAQPHLVEKVNVSDSLHQMFQMIHYFAPCLYICLYTYEIRNQKINGL